MFFEVERKTRSVTRNNGRQTEYKSLDGNPGIYAINHFSQPCAPFTLFPTTLLVILIMSQLAGVAAALLADVMIFTE